MSFDIELIVLNHTRVGENSLVVHTLSQEYGRRSFIIRSLPKAAMAKMMPLSIVEARISVNPKSSLWSMSRIQTVHPLNHIRGNMYKNAMTMFMGETLFRAVAEGANEPGLYEWCRNSVVTLESLTDDFSNYHIRFLLELASALGFSPTRESMAPFAQGYYADIVRMVESSFAESIMLPLNGEQRSGICREIIQYLEFHTESSINIRSLDILNEIFH